MPDKPLRIMLLNTRDQGGGAERVSWDLFREYRRLGHDADLVVGYKKSTNPHVHQLANDSTGARWNRMFWRLHSQWQPQYSRSSTARFVCKMAHRLASPRGWFDRVRGREDFHFPGSWTVDRLPTMPPQIIHVHNLHGHYFDLRALVDLSRRYPVVLTLHDTWLLAGHCAHAIDCDRWKFGCGACPDLRIYPPVRRDATAFNYKRKAEILSKCRLHIVTPCEWLMEKVHQSILAPAIESARVIPYGVDLDTFHPKNRREARAELGLDPDQKIVLFAANGIRNNPFKDFQMMRDAIGSIGASDQGKRIMFLALGESGAPENINGATIQFHPFESDPQRVARFYQAADLYVHAARADTFPNTILEALACGLPVVGTDVGGITEQIDALSLASSGTPNVGTTGSIQSSESIADNANGVLVPAGDGSALAHAVSTLLDSNPLRKELGHNAESTARQRFDLNRQVNDYLEMYRFILGKPPKSVIRPTSSPTLESVAV